MKNETPVAAVPEAKLDKPREKNAIPPNEVVAAKPKSVEADHGVIKLPNPPEAKCSVSSLAIIAQQLGSDKGIDSTTILSSAANDKVISPFIQAVAPELANSTPALKVESAINDRNIDNSVTESVSKTSAPSR